MKRFLFLGLLALTLPLAAELVSQPTPTELHNHPLTEANIAKSAARLLENYGFSKQKFDDEISAKFLDRYLDTLDGQHLHFLQSDAEEFSIYRNRLDDLTLQGDDTSPAHQIFARFMERVHQRVAYVNELLQNEKFTFQEADRFAVDRKDAPRPRDLEEAKRLWRQYLRFQYLQEKLNLRQKEDDAQTDGKKPKAEENLEKEAKAKAFKDSSDQSKAESKAEKKKLMNELKEKQAPLLASLKLSSKEQEKFLSLLADRQMLRDKDKSMFKSDSKTELQNEIATAQKGLESEIKALLGPDRFQQFFDAENAVKIVENLTKYYARLQKNFKELGPDEVLELYLTSLARVYDPHSDYMGRAQLENFNIQMKLSLFGIGAVLQSDDQGYCKIVEVKEGPAKRSKQVKPGDRIIAVAQADKEPVDCVGMKLNKVVEMIRGKKGTEVRLTMLPVDATDPSTQKTVTLIRDEIKLDDQEAKAKVMDLPAADGKMRRIGLIDLPSFYEDMEGKKADHKSTSADISRILKKLNEEKVTGLILDLRRNGGGALSEAIKLSGLFVKGKAPIVQTKDMNGRIDVRSDPDPAMLFDGPMVVLTSRFSASASEILAGALQDYQRALIVGDSTTFGKGTVQQLISLESVLQDSHLEYAYNPGGLKFTIQKFYRAGGTTTQLKGVIPDLILPSVNNYAEIGEKFDFDNALPEDDVSSAKFEKANRIAPYLAELRKNSDYRIQSDRDFGYIQEDIKKYQKLMADKSISLNEAERIKEMDEQKAVNEARRKERQARPKTEEKTYEVNLKNVDKPGLTLADANEDEKAGEKTDKLKVEGEEEDNTHSFDATLEEAKRILLDYILLVQKGDSAVTLK